MKKFFAAGAALAIALAALTGCTSSSTVPNITITGGIGEPVTFESGYPIEDLGNSVELVEQGDAPARDAAQLLVRLTAFNGVNGNSLGVEGALIDTATADQASAWVKKIVETTGYDQRAVVVGTVETMLGPGAGAQLQMQDRDPLVLVADVMPQFSPVSQGELTPLPSGFPTVTTNADGVPAVTLPSSAPPAELLIADSITGTGEEVREGDYVIVQYQGTNWNTGKIFDSSWDRGGPTGLSTQQVVQGFKKALVGQKVGSQVVAVIPPAEGYGDAGNPPNISGTDTIVFVIDILATVHIQ